MSRKFLLATAVVMMASLPAMAQRGGRPAPNAPRGYHPAPTNFSRGSSFGFGVTLGSPYSGLSFGYSNGGLGSPAFGNSLYRPGVGGFYGSGFYGGGLYGNGLYGGTIVPRTFIVPQSYYVPPTTYVPQRTYVVPQTTILPAPSVAPAPAIPAASELGLLITELKPQGTAKAAGLRQGDVILAVDGQRIQSYEELRSVLTVPGKLQASVEYIDGSNGQIEKRDVAIVDGKMGISIEEVPVKRSE